MKEIILASGSPRRKEIMEQTGYDFKVIVSDVKEVIKEGLSNAAIVKDLAYQKAKAVFDSHPDAIVIGSDTIVVADGQIMGKPHSREEAVDMMKKLRNRSHEVITGVVILSSQQQHFLSDTAVVHFRNITNKEIEEYVDTAEPYDKAGGYAIQGWAGRYISRIEGNYYTIVGLPLDKVYYYLRQMVH